VNMPAQLCTFFVDKFFFGVDVKMVQEVLRYQEMTRVPLSPAVIAGLINLRGQIVTAIDLRRRLDLGEPQNGYVPMNVVVRSDDMPISFLVDEIGDVLQVDAAAFERCPDMLSGVARDVITGVYKLEERLLLVLDVEKTVDLSTKRARSEV